MDVSKTQEMEGLRHTLAETTALHRGIRDEFNQARFVRMEGETDAFETFLEVL